jgi:hypothetical protein
MRVWNEDRLYRVSGIGLCVLTVMWNGGDRDLDNGVRIRVREERVRGDRGERVQGERVRGERVRGEIDVGYRLRRRGDDGHRHRKSRLDNFDLDGIKWSGVRQILCVLEMIGFA